MEVAHLDLVIYEEEINIYCPLYTIVRGPLSPLCTTEELLDRKVAAPV
jgi:hypothetical protein